MCGRFNVIDNPDVQQLMQLLGIHGGTLRFSPDIAPGATISVVRETSAARQLTDAVWWLMLDRSTLKPDYRYASFNSRSDRLNQPGAAAYVPFRQSRCIIPASAFIEGLGDKKTYHKIELEDCAIAIGGVYREYLNPETGESVVGASIITLPPLPQWQNIHPKSMPLMLPTDDHQILDAWLSPDERSVERFDDLLKPLVRKTQVVTPIGRPSRWNVIGESFRIEA